MSTTVGTETSATEAEPLGLGEMGSQAAQVHQAPQEPEEGPKFSGPIASQGVGTTQVPGARFRAQSGFPADRVRANTSEEINRQIDQDTALRVRAYSQLDSQEITRRIDQLDREWDIERILEANASALAFTGVAFGLMANRKWLAIPCLVLPFLFLHAVEGWCPPVPLLRRLGIRTRQEIDLEKYALKVLRGDFTEEPSLPVAEAALQAVAR